MMIHHEFMRRIDLDFDLLRCFLAVAEAGGFTAAGERIGLTQSGISVRIRRLEERLGRRLLERNTRRVALTEGGELFLSYARRMVDLNDEAVGRLRGGLAEGRLRLGIADYVVPDQLPKILGRFNRLYPGVKMEMRTGLSMDLLPGFEQGEFDVVLACRSNLFRDGGLLYRDTLVWVAAPDFAVNLDRTVPLVVLPPHCTHRGISLDALDRARIPWEIVYVSSSTPGVQAAVLGGLGLAMVPDTAVIPGLRRLGVEDGLPPLPDFDIAVFLREDVASASCQAFVEFVTAELRAPAAA
jgi:DNA-binding transcriptional LysR family regulator